MVARELLYIAPQMGIAALGSAPTAIVRPQADFLLRPPGRSSCQVALLFGSRALELPRRHRGAAGADFKASCHPIFLQAPCPIYPKMVTAVAAKRRGYLIGESQSTKKPLRVPRIGNKTKEKLAQPRVLGSRDPHCSIFSGITCISANCHL